MKRILEIKTPGRIDRFFCSEKCDNCPLRFKCFTDNESFIEVDLFEYQGKGLELGEEIG